MDKSHDKGLDELNGHRAKKVREERSGMESNGGAKSKRVSEPSPVLLVLLLVACRMALFLKPITASGGQHLPAFKSTPSYTQQMFTKQITK